SPQARDLGFGIWDSWRQGFVMTGFESNPYHNESRIPSPESRYVSVPAEGDHRIDHGRAAGGDPAGGRGHEHQDRRDADEDREINRSPHEVQIEHERERPSHHRAGGDDAQALGNDLRDAARDGRPQGEPDPDLDRAA